MMTNSNDVLLPFRIIFSLIYIVVYAIVWLLSICIYVVYFIIFYGLVFIIIIGNWIYSLIKKKSNIDEVSKRPFNLTRIKRKVKTVGEVKKKLKLFDKSVYDSLFDEKIRHRGEYLFLTNTVVNMKKNGNNYHFKVQGSELYDVDITFDHDNIIYSNCTCPYFKDTHLNCKHIYASMMQCKCPHNHEILRQELNNHIIGMQATLVNAEKYINSHSGIFDYERFRTCYSTYDSYTYYACGSTSYENNKEDSLARRIIGIIEEQEKLQKEINSILNDEKVNAESVKIPIIQKRKRLPSFILTLVLMNYSLTPYSSRKKIEKESRHIRDSYGLNSYETDLVMKGEYKSWQFEYEDLEEDDYYYEG